MSGDGTTDRGAKPPRTLFSLGRPGPKSATAGTGTEEPAAPADVAADTTPVADDATELGCGACGSTLVPGAAFCGECGTPVAQIDDEPFDLVEAAPMGDLGATDFGEHVEELPLDDAPAVLYADADHEPTPVDDVGAAADTGDPDGGAAAVAPPAAVLYADPSQAEPLPPAPSGSFAITEPTYGTSETDLGPAEPGTAGAEPAASADHSVTDAAVGDGPTDESADDYSVVAPLAVAGTAVAAGAMIAGADAAGAEPAEGPVPDGSEPGTTPQDGSVPDAAASGPGAGSDAPTAPAAQTTALPWSDPPTTVAPAAVPIAGGAVAAGSGAVTPPTPVAAAAYGEVPPQPPKSKTGLLVGIAAAVVLVLIVGGVVLATGGSKDEGVQTAQQPTTTVGQTTSTSTATSSTDGPTTTAAPTTTAPPTSETTTATTATTPTTAVPITAAPAPTPPRPPVTAAPTTVPPGRIEANPAAGTPNISIPKGGSTRITLTNVGGTPAGCALTGSNGISVTQNCSPSIAPGQSVVVTVQAVPTWEGPATVTGVLEGSGSYFLTVTVLNG